MRKAVQLMFLGLLVVACKSSADLPSEPESASYQVLATEKFGNKHSTNFNTDSTHILCVGMREESRVKYQSFFIYDLSAGEIVYEPTGRFRKVYWLNADTVRADRLTEVLSNTKGEDYTLYDVKENKILK